MKPTIKPKRTPEQQAEEEAVRRQHAANPVRRRPAGAINRQSFEAILSLVARFKTVRENQGQDASRGGRADGDRCAGSVPIGDRQDAEPHARNAAQMGGGTRAETER